MTGLGYTPDRRDLRDSGTGIEPPDQVLVRAARYSQWDGSQAVPDLAADEILDALADDMMAEGDLEAALRRLMERGWRSPDSTRGDMAGLRDLMDRLSRRREELLDRYKLGDVLADVRRELDEIVSRGAGRGRAAARPRRREAGAGPRGCRRRRRAERRGAGRSGLTGDAPRRGRQAPRPARRAAARRRRPDPEPRGVRLHGVECPRALRRPGREAPQAGPRPVRRWHVGRDPEHAPEELAANREMVRDLNQLLQERVAGRDPDISEFMAKHGSFFPGAQTLDDIIDQLAQRMAALQSLLQSMSSEQRAELQDAMDALLRDDRLRWDLAQLAATMDQLMPGGLGDRYRFGGDEPLGLEGALAQMADLQALDALEEQMDGIGGPGDLADVDRDRVAELLGDEAARDLDALDDLAKQLERAGYLTRDGDRLELTPRGSRRIGQKVLDDLFARLRRDAFGGHRVERGGRGGERDETTKPYEFGDPFHLELRRTLANALTREENAPGRRAGRGVSLTPADFEVFRTEQTTKTSTVLLVDMSRSMLLRGCFVAAKKVAVALDTLIRTQFPRDDLAIVGFAYYAREIRPQALAQLSWHGYEYGTNLQHALMLARRILARSHGANKEIVVITDGEPTAHIEDGQVEFNYPPTRRTITETLREVQRCTKDGITINTFMLERSKALADFVALVTRLNRGRAFYAEPEHLGEYVLVDFVSRRTKHVS